MIKEHSIIFNAAMVSGILEGRKTQTRRVAPIADLDIRPHSDGMVTWSLNFNKRVKGVSSTYSGGPFSDLQARQHIANRFCPYGKSGDRLWVRETFYATHTTEVHCREHGFIHYRADCDALAEEMLSVSWTPSIHMPRWASRITLEITDIKVERLQDISEEDAIAEGCPGYEWCDDPIFGPTTDSGELPSEQFEYLWQSIHGDDPVKGWHSNPWVWVITFKRVESE